jgi:transposase
VAKKYGKAVESSALSENEQEELDRLRKENSRLRMERDILKKVAPGKFWERGIYHDAMI